MAVHLWPQQVGTSLPCAPTGISDQGGMYAKLSKCVRLAPCCSGPAGSQEGLEMDHQSQHEQ